MRKRLLLLLLVIFAPHCLLAQTPVVQTAISRDTIRVGDPFRAVVRIEVPAGTEVVLPDSLPATDDIENAGKMRMRRDSTNGTPAVLATYPLTAWRPGELPLPGLSVLLKTATGEKTIAVALPKVSVLSVLPADTTNIQPKPAKDVLGANRVWWPWLIALVLALALALALWYWWRKRKRVPEVVETVPVIMPRERALEELDRIAQLGLIQEGAFKRFYSLTSEVLRQYIETTERSWGTDLTTDELSKKTRGVLEVRVAIAVLRSADMVKFAKQIPTPEEAARDLARAREFVTEYPAPVSVPAAAEAAA